MGAGVSVCLCMSLCKIPFRCIRRAFVSVQQTIPGMGPCPHLAQPVYFGRSGLCIKQNHCFNQANVAHAVHEVTAWSKRVLDNFICAASLHIHVPGPSVSYMHGRDA